MKRILLLTLFLPFIGLAQKTKVLEIGQTTIDELKMSVYEKDSTANAVVLYEEALRYIDESRSYDFSTDHYYRVKILTDQGKEKANISIDLYKKEKIYDIEAVTYNLENGVMKKVKISDSDVFTKTLSENYRRISFTLPAINPGSVIEYSYTVTSPYPGIDSWYFQSDIPKKESYFSTLLIANWKYKKRLNGPLKLSTSEGSVKKNCIYIEGIGRGHCNALTHGMKDIPAFKKEKYMTSKENFISKLSYDLESFTNTDRRVTKYTTSWEEADLTLKKRFLNHQSERTSFFRRKLPETIRTTTDKLNKAKAIFNFIKNHYTWNKRNWHTAKINIKESFKEKSGAIHDINLSLYNSLQSENIESYIVLLSTRKNGIPSKIYPIITEFNYIIVKAVINGKEYFLDASDKKYSFGHIPFKCLNGEVRVLDFKNGGYWQYIKSKRRSNKSYRVSAVLNEDFEFEVEAKTNYSGYYAYNIRKELETLGKEKYSQSIESDISDSEITSYEVQNEDALELNLIENLKMTIDPDFENTERISFNPIFFDRTLQNPFKSKERLFPVDYGYPRRFSYFFKFKIPENYKVVSLPKKIAKKLSNNSATYVYQVSEDAGLINVYIKFQLSKSIFSSAEYFYLKELYKSIVESEDSAIKLEKI